VSAKTHPLAIVGMSCLFPKADDLQAYWANIKNGVDAITPVPASTHWNAADYFDADPKSPDRTYARSGGFLSPVNFNPMEFGIAPKDIEATDTSQLLSLVAAQRALADAGYAAGGRKFDRERTSVILGVTGALELVIPLGARLGHPIWRRALKDAGVEGAVADDVVQRISDSYVGWQENSFPGLLGNVTAGRIANRLDLGGTNCVVDAACASSLAAIHLAGLELAAGRSDMVITGGVDTFNDIFMYMCFSKTPALSPSGDAKPFDRDCDGTVIGEGLGLLVLKRLADAERDGDRIYAVIKGIGSSSDGRSSGIYAPRAAGQKLALERAFADADVTPRTVGLIEAHGTGTRVGDATELSSLIELFRSPQVTGDNSGEPWCALGSVKSQIGHTKAAAGVAGVIKAAMALHQKVLPPTIKITQPLEDAAPGRSPFYLNTSKRPWLPAAGHPRRAGVSALGFGGTNFHCVLEEHGAAKPGVDWEGGVEILAFGAASPGELVAQLGAHRTDTPWPDFRRAAHASRLQFRGDAEFRLLMVVARESDRAGLKESALKMLEKNPGRTAWTAPAGIAFGSGARHGKLGALFPGQGSQYAGMLRDLACQFPGMLQALAEADEAFAREPSRTAKRLSDYIYPHPVFSEDARQQQETELKATDIAQPALGAVSMGAASVLDHFGVGADAACGHSYGELLALCGAGRINSAALHQLSNLRGRLMAARDGSGDRGAMLAVQADEAAVQEFLREDDGQLVIANRNSPRQYVLSGPLEQIKRALAKLSARAIRSRMLQVSAAFHSPLVADARAPFAEALEGVAFDKGRMPVFANATGREYPAGAKQAREVLAGQIVRPVNFMAQIQAMHAEGVRTFIEVGPGHVLSDLVQSILPGGEVETIALDASRGKRAGSFDLALALARLASLGHEIKLEKWENAPPLETGAGKPALSVPLSGANYRAPTTPRPPLAAVPPAVDKRVPARTNANPVALNAAQEGILALQRLQEQTAQLHKQFLEGQESARRSIQALLELRGGASLPQSIAMPAPIAVATPAVVAPPVVQPAVVEPIANAIDRSRYERAVLEVVCDKTGYPVEMLGLSMGMDSDLGIDSIKRVEIMAALRAKLPEAPEIKPEHLGSLQTLEHVVAFLANGAPANAQIVVPAPAVVPAKAGTQVLAVDISDALLAVVSEKTGYPVEMLNLGMGMDSDLGIDSIKRVEIMAALRAKLPASPEIKPEHLGSLQTLQQVVDFLGGQASEPVMVAAPVAVPVETRIPAKPSHAEVLRQIIRPVELAGDDRRASISLPAGAQVWLAGDDSELCARIEERLRALRLGVRRGDVQQFSAGGAAAPAALIIVAPAAGSDDAFLRHAFRLMQKAGPALRKAGAAGGAILATVSRLDGAFGFDELRRDSDPVSGGLAGLVKTARHEWPEVHCKALDLDPAFTDAAAAADQIAAEILRAGPVEVGLSVRRRVALETVVAAVQPGAAPLEAGDVVVVSGGARGVTGDAALALARAFRPTLVLLGRSEPGEGEPAWLQDLQTEAGIKKALLGRKKGASPKAVEAEYRAVLARREIRAQLGRLEAAAAQAFYFPVDVRDGAALSRVLSEVRRRHGAIRGLVHGAGVLADRRIEDKTVAQFDLVYGTKVAGLRNLLGALAQEDLKMIALFSSYSGRVGRIGQADYAAANEVMNKLAQMEARRRPACRVVSVNWGPWAGGMATPGVRRLFEQEGIGLIEPAAGAAFLVRELCNADRNAVEVLALAPSPGVRAEHPVQELVLTPEDSVAFVREVSVAALPCLESHVFNGRAVLPAALMVEWLAQAALHGNPGMAFHGLDNFKVLKGIVLEARQSVTVSLRTAAATRRDSLHVVPVRMTSRAEGREILHAQADVLLTTDNLPAAPEPAVVDIPGGGFADAYSLGVLFHGAALHGIERVEAIAEKGVAAMLKAASAPIKWMTHPLRGTWIADPLALDSAFQMMILWSTAHRGAPSLPSALGSYRQFVSVFPKGGCRAVIAVALGISAIAVATIQFFDRQGNLLASAEGCEFVMDAALRDAFRLNRLGLEK
jgi:acyl transferase domain-containing protein/acyl carrier protein